MFDVWNTNFWILFTDGKRIIKNICVKDVYGVVRKRKFEGSF